MKELSILFLLFFSLTSFAQEGFMKWNNIPLSDLKMKTYELDEEANAVVLGQTVSAKFEYYGDQRAMIYLYHVRIKILSKAGLDQATIEIPYHSSDQLQGINFIKGYTSTLKDGKIVKTKLTKKDIFNEKVNEFISQKKFTMPSVEVGSIIEYKYQLNSKRLTVLEDFYFQREIPVKWAEVNFKTPGYFEYISLMQTPLPFHISTEKSINYDLGAEYKKVNGRHYHWVVKDAPALVKERFTTTINNHRQRIRIQLKKVQYPGQLAQYIFNTWQDTRKTLMEHNDFGDRFLNKNSTRKTSAKCPAVSDLSMDKEQRVKEIYQFVQNNMKWDGTYGYMADKSFDYIFNTKTGDAGEINLMLVSLLRNAGFDAYPALLSTRKNGKHTPLYPILRQFNYVIAEVMIDDEILLLDAVDPVLPAGMVSFRCLNDQAWSLRGEQGTWINVPAQKSLKIVHINLKLEEDGSAAGFIKSTYKGYDAVSQRREAISSKENVYIEEGIKEDIPNVKIDSLVFKNRDNINAKFYETFYLSIPEAAEVAGDLIYFNPLLNQGWEKNPFKLDERTYPINLGYPFYTQIIMNITPPEGYTIDELPENVVINLLNKGGNFQFLSNTLPNGSTQIISKLKMLNNKYYSEDYHHIKQFFDMVIDNHSTQLVYKKVE